MPLYEYKCEKCGESFEVMQKFSDQPLTVHEKCGGPVQRLLSAPALQFKGSGWYITDYAKDKASATTDNGGNKESKSSETAAKTEPSSTPAAPASTSESKSTSSETK